MTDEPSFTVVPKQDPAIYLHMALAEAEDDGWKVEFSTTGGLLLLAMTKDGERPIKESIDLTGLYTDWVTLARDRAGTMPQPPTTPRRVARRKEPTSTD